ncbi:hypothetical protein [Allocoleopsis sp.]|uniref:hypothetical protein n=1 Tax=Allocoleopsis sp. TaxID=3088169 RepID=UPI002FD5CFBC
MAIKASSITPKTDPTQFQNQTLLAWNPDTKSFDSIAKSAIAPGSAKWTKVTTIGGGWVNSGADFPELAYCLDGNFIRIAGTLKSGTLGAIVLFTLPPDCRPDVGWNMPISCSDASGAVKTAYLFVGKDGTVALNATDNAAVGLNVSIPKTRSFF